MIECIHVFYFSNFHSQYGRKGGINDIDLTAYILGVLYKVDGKDFYIKWERFIFAII